MREQAPSTIQRMLTLRQVPAFADAELPDLATIAENLVERTFYPGETVAAPLQRLPAIHLVVHGRFEAVGTQQQWGPRRVFGALEAIAGRPMAEHVIARDETRTLQISTAAFAEILEDNYSVLASVRRTLARRLVATGAVHPPRPRALVDVGASPLGMVERLLALRGQLPFARASLQALSTLAQATEEINYLPRVALQRAGDEPDGCLVILEGNARLRRKLVGPGTAIGGLETLAEIPYIDDAEAVTSVRALRLPAGALFDVMEDHTDFSISLASKLAGEVLDGARLSMEVN